MWCQTTQAFNTHLLSRRRLSHGGKGLNASAENVPLIFLSALFITLWMRRKKKKHSAWGDLTIQWDLQYLDLNPGWFLRSWIGVYWASTCQYAIKAVLTTRRGCVYALWYSAHLVSTDSLHFPLDDDLGKSDSSSGSMDSFQVGPPLSAGCSHLVSSLGVPLLNICLIKGPL